MDKNSHKNEQMCWVKQGSSYLITNTVNDKIYIGITKKTIRRRWCGHVNGAKSGTRKSHLRSAILKYGEDKFTICILKSCYSDYQLYESEKYFIKKYNSTKSKIGYNKSTGGEQSASGVRLTRKRREHLASVSTFKKGFTPWNKNKKGVMPEPWNKGEKGVVKHSARTIRKMKKAHKGKKYSLGTKRSKQAILKTTLKNTGKKRTKKFRKWLSEYFKKHPNRGGRKNKGKKKSKETKRKISQTLKSRSDNRGIHSPHAKLTERDVLEIRRKYKPWKYSYRRLVKEYGVTRTTLSAIINKRSWRHLL